MSPRRFNLAPVALGGIEPPLGGGPGAARGGGGGGAAVAAAGGGEEVAAAAAGGGEEIAVADDVGETAGVEPGASLSTAPTLVVEEPLRPIFRLPHNPAETSANISVCWTVFAPHLDARDESRRELAPLFLAAGCAPLSAVSSSRPPPSAVQLASSPSSADGCQHTHTTVTSMHFEQAQHEYYTSIHAYLIATPPQRPVHVQKGFQRLRAVVLVELCDLVDADHFLPIPIQILPAPVYNEHNAMRLCVTRKSIR